MFYVDETRVTWFIAFKINPIWVKYFGSGSVRISVSNFRTKCKTKGELIKANLIELCGSFYGGSASLFRSLPYVCVYVLFVVALSMEDQEQML